MLSSPQKTGNQYYCSIESPQDFIERCQIIKEGDKYIADLNGDNNPTEQFEELILNELENKASEWFDIPSTIVTRFFLYSGDNLIITFEEDITIKEEQIYEIRFRPNRLLIDKSSFQIEYLCYFIEEEKLEVDNSQDNNEDNMNIEDNNEEDINLLANLDTNRNENINQVNIAENQVNIEKINQELEQIEALTNNEESTKTNNNEQSTKTNDNVQSTETNNNVQSTETNNNEQHREIINVNNEGNNDEHNIPFSIVGETQDIDVDNIFDTTGQYSKFEKLSQKTEILRKIRELRIQSTMLQIQANKMEEDLYNQL
jgi:hypothetical protein